MSNQLAAHEALTRLIEGNQRYASNVRSLDAMVSHGKRGALATGQLPYAIILGCSDSRVPAEIVFDQGLGDLFVIRVAGNIVAPSQVGSVEFAAERFGVRLVVVMGHSGCGAIDAAIEAMGNDAPPASTNMLSIVDRIRPAIVPLMHTELAHDAAHLRREAVRANVLASANHLRHGSAVLEHLILNRGLRVVGAEYDLETGLVDFFDGVPSASRPWHEKP